MRILFKQSEDPQLRYRCAVSLGFSDWIVVVLVLMWIFLRLLGVVWPPFSSKMVNEYGCEM